MSNEKFIFEDMFPYFKYMNSNIVLFSDMEFNGKNEITWNFNSDYELIFLHEGKIYIKTECDEFKLHVGDFHIMSPFKKYIIRQEKGETVKLFSIHFDMINIGADYDFSLYNNFATPFKRHDLSIGNHKKSINNNYFLFNNIEFPQKITVKNVIAYLEILEKADTIYNNKPLGYELDMIIYLLQIIRMLINENNYMNIDRQMIKNDTRLIDCIKYINANYSNVIDFEKMAKSHGLKLCHLRKLFKELTGKPCNEYLINVRIENAIKYIKSRKYSISEVSKMVGYNDIHYFSRLFKKKKGFAPSKTLKNNKCLF